MIKMKIPTFDVPKRYVIVFMMFMGYTNITILHTNLSMAVVDMTTVKNISTRDGGFEMRAEFNWTSEQKGLLLSSYSYGRLFNPVCGFLATKFGGGTTSSIGIVAMATITSFSPLLLSADFNWFFITYVAFGAFEALLIAGVPELISRWSPPNERSRFVSFTEVGFFFGAIAAFAMSGLVLEKCSWQMLFYSSGLASFIWAAIWLLVVTNDPSKDKSLNEAELEHIRCRTNTDEVEEKLTYPWRSISTFIPLWVASLAEFSVVSGLIFTSVFLPQYIKDTTAIDIEDVGFISTIPQICSLISMPACGCLADYIRSLGKLSITNVHRLFASVSLFSAAIFYAIVVVYPNFLFDIAAISLYQLFSTLTLVDVTVLFLDISPRYAAFLLSIVNTFAIASGFIVPALVESIVTSHNLSQWNTCFVIYSGMYFLAALLYLKFVSADQPKWAANDTIQQQNELPPT